MHGTTIRAALIGLALAGAGIGCNSSKDASKDADTSLHGTTAGAKGFGVAKNVGSGAPVVLAINDANEAVPVFDQVANAVGVIATKSHLIVNGAFVNVRASSGELISCRLVALPLGTTGAQAICLERDPVGGITGAGGQGWGLGVDVVSQADPLPDLVVFGVKSADGLRLKSWDGGADIVTEFYTATGDRIFDVYASRDYRLFVRENAGTGLDGTLFYKTDAGFSSVATYRDEPLRVGSLVFAPSTSTKDKFDLSSGVYTPGAVTTSAGCSRGVNYGSRYQPVELKWTTGTFAYWIADGALCRIGADGVISTVDNSVAWSEGIRQGDKVLLLGDVIGSPKLTELDLVLDAYDSTNLLGGLGLLEVSDLAEYVDGIVVKGTDSGGAATTVYFNTTTDAVDAVTTSAAEFTDVIYVQ
jgi:hypothetical protein